MEPEASVTVLKEKTVEPVDRLAQMKETCRSLAEVTEGNTHQLAAKLWELGLSYMDDFHFRTKRSLYSALVIAVGGIGFFYFALVLMLSNKLQSPKLTLIAGVSIQIISGIGFYLYARTAREFFAFHVCLERVNRFLLANTICQNLDQPLRDKMRRELVHLIVSAPPLSMSEHSTPLSGEERGELVIEKAETEASTSTN